MISCLSLLCRDEAGFIISSELVLVGSICVIAMVVGLAEVSFNVSTELEDVGSSIGHVNQSYSISGTQGHKAKVHGSWFTDSGDFCDGQHDITCDTGNGYGWQGN